MKIKTAEELIDFGPYNNWYDDNSDARVMDTNDVVKLMKQYAAQFIDLAADSCEEVTIEGIFFGEETIDKETILNLKKQLR